jgi:16S rRNA (guanine966-N2)-methyltransferase
MRIIAGSARGRRLVAPKGMTTRPTPDRVKEALFSILGPRTNAATVLDLFAGSGALGLEALSRGARYTTFVESDRDALAALGKNAEAVGRGEHEIVAMPAARAVVELSRRGRRYDLVFLDPPFATDLLAFALGALLQHSLLLPQAWVVCEHPGDAPSPAAPAPLQVVDTRRYGDVSFSLLSHEKGPSP